MGSVRGPRPELERVTFTKEKAKELLEGMQYHLMGREPSRDKYFKELTNINYALVMGRLWLSRRQYRTAEFYQDKMAKEMQNYNKICKPKRKLKLVK